MPGPHNEPSFMAWVVKLQKLGKDGTYNHKARIKFMYEDGIFTDEARLDKFSIVGKMKKIKKEIKTKIDYFI